MEPVALDVPPALRELSVTEAPFAGTLRAGEPPTLWVDVEDFASSPAWAAAATEHVLAPMDAAGSPDGPRVILPHCPVRLEDVLTEGSSPGELVTVAVSALRGAAEADLLGAEAGRWWVTVDGRPVLALTGTAGWRDDTVALLRRTHASDPALRQALERAAAAVGDPRLLRREAEAIEGALFAAAEPEPLPTGRREHAVPPARRERASTPQRATGGVVSTAHELIARLVDAGIADRLGRVWSAVVRRSPEKAGGGSGRRGSRGTRRRGVVLVAAGVATAVIIVGAPWPATDGDRPAAAVGAPEKQTQEARPSASADHVQTPKETPGADEGPAEMIESARDLVDALLACADAPCREALWEDPSVARSIAAADDGYAVEVVDEYGGAAAVRIVTSEVTQVLVMVRVEKRWLVREVYDLADQP